MSRTPITQQRLRAILNTDPFRGRLLKEHAQRHSANTLDRVRTQVRLGMVNEESIPEIVRRVRGRQVRGAARGFTGGVLATNTRDAEALVRTAVTHVSSRAKLETYQENARILKGVRFLSAGDDRVTALCASLDGTFWSMDSSEIQTPPLHWSCRSDLVPEPDYEGLGLEPPEEGERVFRDMSTVDDKDLKRKVSARRRTGDLGKSTRRPGDMTMHDWIREQRPAVQNRILGKERADLFRAGQIKSLKDLIAGDNSLIPLDELLRN